jgi:hypothetical protein
MNDLTTLTNLKGWLNTNSAATANPNPSQDITFQRLITSTSSNILSALLRPSFISQIYTDDVSCFAGRPQALLRQWPVTSVLSVKASNCVVPAATAGSGSDSGYTYDSWDGMSPGNQAMLYTPGYGFSCQPGQNNVTYQAGYLCSDALVIGEGQIGSPAQSILQPLESLGIWSYDNGVVGVPSNSLTGLAVTFTKIPFAAGTSPGAGTYMVQSVESTGLRMDPPNYLFSPADIGVDVVISYSYVPYSVEQAAIETIQDMLSYKSRVGIKSKNLGGQESVSYIDRLSFMPTSVQAALQPYMRTTLI